MPCHFQGLLSHVLLLVTGLPLFMATFAFVLRFRDCGGRILNFHLDLLDEITPHEVLGVLLHFAL